MSSEVRPAARPLRRLAIRSVGLGVLTASVVSAGLLVYDMVHRTHYESLGYFAQFTGWQLYVTLAGLAVVAAAVGVAAVLLRRRWPLPAGAPRHSQVFWALVAIALGAAAGDIADLGSKHVLDWASKHTTAAHRAAAADRADALRILGTATHRPAPVTFPHRRPAPAKLAAPLLRPVDLGTTWQYTFSPGVTALEPTVIRPTGGVTSGAITDMSTAHWNGTYWVTDQDLIESVKHFADNAAARRSLRTQLLVLTSCRCVHRSRDLGHSADRPLQVWTDDRAGSGPLHAYVLDSHTLFYLFIGGRLGPTAMSRQQILKSALRRITQTG